MWGPLQDPHTVSAPAALRYAPPVTAGLQPVLHADCTPALTYYIPRLEPYNSEGYCFCICNQHKFVLVFSIMNKMFLPELDIANQRHFLA